MTVAPPAHTVWWDQAATLDAVLAQLRLGAGDVDEDRLAACVDAAGRRISNRLDWDGTDPGPWDMTASAPADVQLALEATAIRIYRTKDAGTSDPADWSVDALVTRYGAVDPLADSFAMIDPYRSRFGIG